MSKEIWKYVGPALAYIIKIGGVCLLIWFITWYFEIGWAEIKDLVIIIINKLDFGL